MTLTVSTTVSELSRYVERLPEDQRAALAAVALDEFGPELAEEMLADVVLFKRAAEIEPPTDSLLKFIATWVAVCDEEMSKSGF